MLSGWLKARARRHALARREGLAAGAPDAAHALAGNFPDAAWPAVNAVVSGYWPVRGEIDPRPLMETFLLEQAQLALPVVIAKDAPLQFRAWTPGDGLEKGAFGIDVPEARKPVLVPSLVLVPLAAFDDRCHRLGYGGGFYDRTLSALRTAGPVIAVGLAYEGQRVGRISAGRHDVALDYVVTEQRCYRAAR
ncbi:MAG: 5-formyltetrahydrofolate cyclo-ligase [Caulobacterales bacterium]|uniref:5-formyltetrahydrofolate cyclo-ligase n=1 Tax=Glycocaulis sp. TaxID=1969725 RepID=UPI003FA16357